MTVDEMRSRLIEIIKDKSVERRDVTLSSGRKSNLYIDCRQTTLNPEGAYLTGKILLDVIKSLGEDIEAVGGLTMGADPMVTSVAIESYRAGNPMPAFIVRKESKGHGLNKWIEGKKNIKKGAKVAVIEDVVTTGGSVLKAVRRAEDEGLIVVLVLALVDREEGGADRIREAGYRFKAVFGRKDILGE